MVAATPRSHHFISQRIRLHYLAWGDPSAPPLFLQHGAMDHCRNWDAVANAFCADWHVIAPDLRGHGDSGWSADGSYGYSSYVYDMTLMIERLFAKPLTIVAHSMGANVALRSAGLYPAKVRRLAAIEGIYPAPQNKRQMDVAKSAAQMRKWIDIRREMASRNARKFATIEEVAKRMRSTNGHLDAALALHLAQHAVIPSEDGYFYWKFDAFVRALPPADLASLSSARFGQKSPARYCWSTGKRAGCQTR